jgi:hypothetical protein
MKHSESIKQIAPALVRAQAEIGVVVANSKNPFFNSTYANLDVCWDALKGPLQKEGIALIQTLGFIPGAGPTLITTLLHSSGEYISGEQPVCAAKDDPQGVGSAITYARRYGLSAILALVQVDDDAEGAMNDARKPKEGGSPGPTGKPDLKAVPDPGDYKFTCGKHSKDGKSMKDLGQHGVDAWLRSMKDLLEEKNEGPAKGKLANDMAAAEAFLSTRSHERGELPRGAK